jgi:hypothetical protein
MLVAVGGRAKELLFGAKPSRHDLKKASGICYNKERRAFKLYDLLCILPNIAPGFVLVSLSIENFSI